VSALCQWRTVSHIAMLCGLHSLQEIVTNALGDLHTDVLWSGGEKPLATRLALVIRKLDQP